MSFSVYALTPLALATGGSIPDNVPNISYKPMISYGLTKLSPDFDAKDNANLALVQLKLPPGAVTMQLFEDVQVKGLDKVSLPSEGIMPDRDLHYTAPVQGVPSPGLHFTQGPPPVPPLTPPEVK